MANRAKNSTRAKPKQRSRQSTNRSKAALVPRVPRPTVPSMLVHQVCGLVDPFCEHARGAKYPDDSSARTLPFTIQFRSSLSTNEDGNAACAFFPQVGTRSVRVNCVPGTELAPVWEDFGLPEVDTFVGVSQYRIVSVGVRLRRISAPLTTSGMVYTRIYADGDGSGSNGKSVSTYAAAATGDIPLQDSKEQTVVVVHTAQMPQMFYDLQSPTEVVDWQAAGFGYATIGVVGGPPETAVLEIEFLMHVEYLFEAGAALALAATPAPRSDMMVTKAAASLTSNAKLLITNGVSSVGSWVAEKAKQALIGYLDSRSGGMVSGMRMLTVD